MHKIYENDDLMMYFKKRYCHCCGKVLQTKKTERIVRKEDPEHRSYCSIGTTYKPHGDILVIGKEYCCPSCNRTFSCDEQSGIIEAQKYYKRNIVSEEEIVNVKKNNIAITNNNILKMRWLLLIPIFGGLICMFNIFNGRLSYKTKNNDLHKIILSSILVFIGVAIVVKFVLSTFNAGNIFQYTTIPMLIPSLLSFNIPMLWYINHTFKDK